jgi:hypothetical protein
LARAGLVVVGFGVLVLSFFLGLFFLIIAVGLALIAGAVVAVRRWLGPGRSSSPDSDNLQVEYRVIRRDRSRNFDRD